MWFILFNIQNVCVTFWDHSLECVILPLDNVLVYLMSLDWLATNVNPIIGKLLVEMDVNRAIVTQSDLFLNNVTRYEIINCIKLYLHLHFLFTYKYKLLYFSLTVNVNVNQVLVELNVINVKQIIGVIQIKNVMVNIFTNMYWVKFIC